MDYYKTLGVGKDASESEIKKAYRKMAQKYHPDTGKGDESKFKEVAEAYEVVGDKQKRAQYDQFGAAGPGFDGGRPEGAGFGGFDFKNVNVDLGGNFGDIFDTFFSGDPRRAQKKGGASKGGDIEMVMQISFEDAIFGSQKDIEVSRFENCSRCEGMGAEPGTELKTCETCSGTGQQVKIQRTPFGQIQTAAVCQSCEGAGRIPEKKCKTCEGEGRLLKNSRIQARIPAGISDQSVIKLSGKGEAGVLGGPYGDLFLHISVVPSKEYDRIKNDIYTTEHIHVLQAIMGDEIPIKTVHGEVKLKIPSGTQSGSSLRLKGYGVPIVGSSNRGDHHVKIKVEIPRKLSGKEKKLYDELVEETKLDIKPQNKGLFG